MVFDDDAVHLHGPDGIRRRDLTRFSTNEKYMTIRGLGGVLALEQEDLASFAVDRPLLVVLVVPLFRAIYRQLGR